MGLAAGVLLLLFLLQPSSPPYPPAQPGDGERRFLRRSVTDYTYHLLCNIRMINAVTR